jgi:diguanylate cyclase (GGDEF)-like protein
MIVEKGKPILVVDDEDSIRSVLSQVLGEDGFKVTEAASGEAALALFQKQPFDLVITDIVMPGINGIELLTKIKELNSDAQVIIMTSYASLDTAVSALRSGAYDYIFKPFEDIDVITAAARRAAEKIRLITENQNLIERLTKKTEELEKANNVLKKLAIRDGLTGLFNHRYFQEDLAYTLRRAGRYKRIFSIVFLDIDHFKNYNDIHGHTQGDKLLRTLGQILKKNLRKSDLIARYGGDEFVITLPETAKAKTRMVAEKICKFVSNYNFEGRETQPLKKVTLSIGVASYPEDGTDGSSLIQCADQALYQAKKSGRDRVCVAASNLKNVDKIQKTTPIRPQKNDHVLKNTNAASGHECPV